MQLARSPLFELANHSYSHPLCTAISADSLRHELALTEKLLLHYTGTSPRLFRPPFGSLDTSVVNLVHTEGLTTVLYDLASGDPDSSLPAENVLRYVERTVRNGSIIVMHMNGRGWHTAAILPQIIGDLRKKGFQFVKVSELISFRNK
jgi:peptidoglycan-N-acetylglucosamine deacetylase